MITEPVDIPGDDAIRKIVERHQAVTGDPSLVAALLEIHPEALNAVAKICLHSAATHEDVALCPGGLRSYTTLCLAIGMELAQVLAHEGNWKN